MNRSSFPIRVPKPVAAVALAGFLAWGCGGDGPTEPAPVSLPDLFGPELYRADGSVVGVEVLGDVALIGVYFASPECPACGGFTPALIDAYQELRSQGKSFEVVLVSLGSGSSMFDHMTDSNMPWLAVPSPSTTANALVHRYDVRWIPTLVVIDGSAKIVTTTGREDLSVRGVEAYDDWLAASSGS